MRGQAFVDVVQNVNQGVIDVGHDVGKSATLLEGAGVFIPFLVLNVLYFVSCHHKNTRVQQRTSRKTNVTSNSLNVGTRSGCVLNTHSLCRS